MPKKVLGELKKKMKNWWWIGNSVPESLTDKEKFKNLLKMMEKIKCVLQV